MPSPKGMGCAIADRRRFVRNVRIVRPVRPVSGRISNEPRAALENGLARRVRWAPTMEKTRREWDGFLALLAEKVIAALVSSDLGIREGVVMSLAGVAPYRRLDCDGKALCYVRCRPQKRAVRIDVSGLWCRPAQPTRLIQKSSSLTLMVSRYEDVGEAAEYLRTVVQATRSLAA
jgi:hypothetical protein